MPYTAQHKQESRLRILESAAYCFLHQGYDGTGIDEIMRRAGLTRGAFYAHFKSKSDLYAKAMVYAARQGRLMTHQGKEMEDAEWLRGLFEGYLNREHLTGEGIPCPMAFLVADIANREPEVRRIYTQIYKGMNRMIGQRIAQDIEAADDKVFAVTAMMIGAVALGRVIDDSETAERILNSCRRSLIRLLDI